MRMYKKYLKEEKAKVEEAIGNRQSTVTYRTHKTYIIHSTLKNQMNSIST